MTQTGRLLLAALLTSGLATGGYAYQRGRASQAARLAQIGTLAAQLTANNQQRTAANAATRRSIAHLVCLNYNQPADLAVLTQTQRIQARTQALVDSLKLLRRQLLNSATSAGLASPLMGQFNRYAAFIQCYTNEADPLTQPGAAED